MRVNSVAMAAALRHRYAANPIFTLATRDMNRLALESLLLGAQALELENVIVVAGDPFGPQDAAATVNDYRATELIAAIAQLNSGIDYRGRNLRAPTDFCIGATVDLGRGIEREATLAVRKAQAGAHFLITQPVYDPADVREFNDACGGLTVPVFYGVGLMEPDGVSFAAVPEWAANDLAAGRPGVDIALEVWTSLQAAGATDCYLVPPYAAAAPATTGPPWSSSSGQAPDRRIRPIDRTIQNTLPTAIAPATNHSTVPAAGFHARPMPRPR